MKDIDKTIALYRKANDTEMLEIAKLIKAAFISNEHSEKPLTDVEVIQKMVKEREKAIDIYNKAGRQDLAKKETTELYYIKGLLPKEPSKNDIIKVINNFNTDLTIKDTKLVIEKVQAIYPTAQKGTIVKIFKSLL